MPINAFDTLKRRFGAHPFEDVDFRYNLIERIFSAARKTENKIRRAIELQAAQIYQNGMLALTDHKTSPTTLHTEDFKPKATHFPTTTGAWDSNPGNIRPDILALSEIILTDGLSDTNCIITTPKVFEVMLAASGSQNIFDNRRYEMGMIAPTQMGKGMVRQGYFWIGNYMYEIYTYNARYEDPDGTTKTYLTEGNLIICDKMARMDATFGMIPNFGRMLDAPHQSTNLLPELPSRMPGDSMALDLFINSWLSQNGEQFFIGYGSRPLLIPTAIDTFGCIRTLIT